MSIPIQPAPVVVPAEPLGKKIRDWILTVVVTVIAAILANDHAKPAPVLPKPDPPTVVVVPPTPKPADGPPQPVTPATPPTPPSSPSSSSGSSIAVAAGVNLLRVKVGDKFTFANIKFDNPATYPVSVEVVNDVVRAERTP